MKYFKNPDDGEVYGYDENEPSQLPYIDRAVEAGWEDITDAWPLAVNATLTIEQAKAFALQHVALLAQSAREKIAGTSDALEVAGWPNKLRIAQAIKAGKASDDDKAAFQAEINLRGIPGETLKSFAEKAIANAAKFSLAAGVIDGIKRAAQDSVNSAESQDDIDTAINAMRDTLVHSLGISADAQQSA